MGASVGRFDKEWIGERTQMVLECIWEHGDEGATVQDIIGSLEHKCGIRFSSSSVNVIVLNLVRKGLAMNSGRKNHQAYIYLPAITQDEFRRKEIARLCRNTFDGDLKLLMGYVAQMSNDMDQ